MKEALYYITLIGFVLSLTLIMIALIVDEDMPFNYTNLTYTTIILYLISDKLKKYEK